MPVVQFSLDLSQLIFICSCINDNFGAQALVHLAGGIVAAADADAVDVGTGVACPRVKPLAGCVSHVLTHVSFKPLLAGKGSKATLVKTKAAMANYRDGMISPCGSRYDKQVRM